MKNAWTLIFTATVLCMAILFAGCHHNADKDPDSSLPKNDSHEPASETSESTSEESPDDTSETEGLRYSLRTDGTYAVSGMGAASGRRLIIPSVHNEKAVTAIGSYAFDNCDSLETVILPNSITDIESSAFSGCTNLKSIVIPEGVISIGSSAFSGCGNLKSITIPNSVKIIGSDAFGKCDGLTSVTIPAGVTRIDSFAFSECTNLQSITIPESSTFIGMYAFYKCGSLTSAVFENPDGWSVLSSQKPISGLEDASVAADYLTGAYQGEYWTNEG